MPASDLFKDFYDVQFRLHKTHIVVGNSYYFVSEVVLGESGKALLMLAESDTPQAIPVYLDRLPLSSMYACPSGYYNGFWYTRGPSRSRHQGLVSSSFWGVHPSGHVQQGSDYSTSTILAYLLSQPRRATRKKPYGLLTRDVFVEKGSRGVLVRGRRVGILDEKFHPLVPLPTHYQELLNNARIPV